MKYYLAVVLSLLSASALAQNAQPPSAPPPPCARGATPMAIGNFDIDEMRCHMSIADEEVTQLTKALIGAQATIQMISFDLKRAMAAQAAAEKEMAAMKAPPAPAAPK